MLAPLATLVLLPALSSPADHSVPAGLSRKDWSSLCAAYEASRDAVRAVEGGYRARSSAQRWSVHYDGRGVTIEPDQASWTWGLELKRWGLAGSEVSVEKAVAVRADGSRVGYTWPEGLEEWYVNDARGLEHGYTVHARPRARETVAPAPLTFTLAVRGGLRAEVSDGGRGARFSTEAGADVLTYTGLLVLDADRRELPAWFEACEQGLRLSVDESEARYPIVIDPIAQQAYLKASDNGTGNFFGRSVSISGDTVVIGAHKHSTGSFYDAGAAYVFVREAGTWSQQAILADSDPNTEENFGYSVSVSGDTIVVGAPYDHNPIHNEGGAFVFVRNGTTWTQQAHLVASNPDPDDLFGASVSVWGDTVVVGAFGENSGATGIDGDQTDESAFRAGAAYVFVRDGSTWSQQAYLKASNTQEKDYFGAAVAVHEGTILVGAYQEDGGSAGVDGDQSDNSKFDSGAAYVFARSGSSWIQEAYLKASNPGALDLFGVAVSLSGDVAAVGAMQEDSSATGIDGDQGDNSAQNSGAAYIFERAGLTWAQRAYVKASNTGSKDLFGWSLSLSEATLLVGAYAEDSAATGVDGDEVDDSAPDAGAAYLFERDTSTWTQRAYLKASNAEGGDLFGLAVSVSEGTAVMTATGEDSGATGVNGDPSDNSVPSSGAAYVFDLDVACATLYCGASKNPANAALIAIDTCDSASSSITLSLTNGPPNQFAYLLVGDGNGTVSRPPGSDGDLCLVGGACLGRYVDDIGQIDGAGQFETDIVHALSVPCGGAVILAPGSTWNFQYWHRQPQNLPSTFSEAIAVTFE